MDCDHSMAWAEVIDLKRPSEQFRAAMSVTRYSPDVYEQRTRYLHPRERENLDSLRHDRRIQSYLVGRYATKRVVSQLTGVVDLSSIWIRNGVFQQPIVSVPGVNHVSITLSHSDEYAAALAFPDEHPMGIDIEKIDLRTSAVILEQLTEAERTFLNNGPMPFEVGVTMFWSAKEALSKALKTGLTTPLQVYEIERVAWRGATFECRFRNFAQFKVLSFEWNGYVVSQAVPWKTELGTEVHVIRQRLDTFYDLG